MSVDGVLAPFRLFHQPQAVPCRGQEQQQAAPAGVNRYMGQVFHPGYLAIMRLPFCTQGIVGLSNALSAFRHEVPRDIRVQELQSGA